MSQKQLTRFNIDFMSQRKVAAVVSIALTLGALLAIVINGLNLALDFTGGTQARVTFSDSVNLDQVRVTTTEYGFDNPSVVYYGSQSEVMIRFQGSLEELAIERINGRLAELAPGAQIESVTRESDFYQSRVEIAGSGDLAALGETLFPPEKFGEVRVEPQQGGVAFLLRGTLDDPIAAGYVEALQEATGQRAQLEDLSYVGSQVGAEMAENAVLGLLTAMGCIMLYISLRFQYKFAIGAVAGLFHDAIMVVGFFAVTQLEVDLTVLAALLAAIGYSINDSIVVSDRIRENFRRIRKATPTEVINISINQTLARTLITSLTTLFVLLALLLYGGDAIRGFAIALIVGVIVGTYSTIYIASNVFLALKVTKEDLMVPVKEGAELNDAP